MILTKDVIKKEIKNKRVKISDFKLSQIGPASIDLTLGDWIRVYTKKQTLTVSEKTDALKLTKKVSLKKGYKLKPGELVLGITKEKLTLPDDIAGWIHSRSRFARLGLMMHMTAPFLQPGISNHQTLEIYNASQNILVLKPGVKVCSVVLSRVEGKAHYKGRYKNQ